MIVRLGMFLTGRDGLPFGARRGSSSGLKDDTMIETVTALFGFLSAGILAAHAYDGYRARF